MAKQKQIEVNNTGFGNNTEVIGNRLLLKNGDANAVKSGLGFWERISPFHTLLKMDWLKFIGLTFITFVVINLFFTFLYFLAGIQHLNGLLTGSHSNKLLSVFFFSVQTFTTVGYGHISPNNVATSSISGIEAFSGLLFFALVTGLLYARFSKPNAFVKFSYNAVIAPYQGYTALMLRLSPFKNNQLTDVTVNLRLAMVNEKDGKKRTEFFTPKLEIDSINSLVLSWTIVHPIDAESPLYGLTHEEMNNAKIEVLVFLKGFDETYSTSVVARTSYLYNEIKWGYKFIPMYVRSEDASSTLIDINKLNTMEQVALA
jgi:inward rectifier potassium channel